MKKMIIAAISNTPKTTPTTIPAIAPLDNDEDLFDSVLEFAVLVPSAVVATTVLVVVTATILLLSPFKVMTETCVVTTFE